MQDDTLIVRGLALAAAILYALTFVARSNRRASQNTWRYARAFWTAGCLIFLLHVILAFSLIHGWSHRSAYEHTARRTADFIDVYWGGGLYFNYVFTAVWVADVMWWWISPRTYLERRWLVEWAVQLFMAFMFINGVVVFGSPLSRWTGGLAILVLLFALWNSGRRSVNKEMRNTSQGSWK